MFHFDPGFLMDELVRRACDCTTGNAGLNNLNRSRECLAEIML